MSGLVSLLNGFQVVRMVELLGLFGCVDYIREEVGLGSGGVWSGPEWFICNQKSGE